MKKKATDAVETAILRRALGYKVREMTIIPDGDPDSDSGEKITKIVEKDVAPSIQACLCWLKAYRPEIWGKAGAVNDDSDPAELYKALEGSDDVS
ncbi:MAG: hypothetical protein LBM41_00765 [Ruminococcus sp.]|jgi:hypothetical protein|nr:hypothetical protein [Ruminococcus sp.]